MCFVTNKRFLLLFFYCFTVINLLAQNDELSWADISSKSKKSVVQIFAYTKEPHYFARYKTPEDSGCTGTGFIINNQNGNDDIEILTNFHVVDQAVKLFAQFPELSKEKFELEFVGGYPQQDVALLRLKKDDCEKIKTLMFEQSIQGLEFGDSDELKEAQEIMTLGYPGGQENIKSSRGDVSGRESTYIGECIQTTAPINPGNSGGPFLNKQGQVIGICVLKRVAKGFEGIAYLIPINNVKMILPQLRKSQIVRGPYWGFSYQAINDTLIEYLNLPVENGVLVTKIFKGSISEKSGLLQEDIICSVNGETVDRYGYIKNHISLFDYLKTVEFDSNMEIVIYRAGDFKKLFFDVKESDFFKIKEFFYGYELLPEYEVIGGLVFTELSLNQIEMAKYFLSDASYGDLKKYLKYLNPENWFEPKLIISYMIPGSDVSNSRCLDEISGGIPADFIIKEVNDTKVSTIDEFREAVLTTQDYLKLKMEGGSLVVISVDQIIKEDYFLSQQEGFERSNLVDLLARKYYPGYFQVEV